jgi:threonine dehydrogenase-like Zn-dependent dehydrogenase
VAACCSGATAANAVERAGIRAGDTVLVIGPGPLGLFCTAMARRAGAGRVFVVGTARSRPRLALAREFGADASLCLGETTESDRRAFLLDHTHGVGPNVVLDCSGAPSAVTEFLPLTAPGGVYSLPGIAEPREPLPVKLFEWLARKSVSLQGVWVSDTRHLYQAIQLVLSGEFPFEKLVTHRFPLDQATAALEAADSRQAIKAVLMP